MSPAVALMAALVAVPPPGLPPPAPVPLAPSCPADPPTADEPVGTPVPRPPVVPAAAQLNHDGNLLYTAKQFAAAQQKYRAALAADPDFLAPRLHLAGALARQERHAEAAREAATLITRGFVPWAREIETATDLLVLREHKDGAPLAAARAAAAAAWGRAVDGGLLLVARLGEPVTMPPAMGSAAKVLVIGARQEIVAFLPHRGRFLQVTAEDGRLLGFARSPNGHRVVYARAEKLVVQAGQPPRFRDLSVRLLDLRGMVLSPAFKLAGDVAIVELGFGPRGEAWVWAGGEGRARGGEAFAVTETGLSPTVRRPAARSGGAAPTRITPGAVEPASGRFSKRNCNFRSNNVTMLNKTDKSVSRRVTIKPARGAKRGLPSARDLALFGLPVWPAWEPF